MNKYSVVSGFFLLTLLAGCASDGVMSEAAAPSETFEVAANYHAAQRRAAEYLRTCYVAKSHPYGVTYQVNSAQGEKGAPNDVRLTKESEPAKVLVRIVAKESGPATSAVTVTVLGSAGWDMAEIAAAKASIQSATPVCRANTPS